MDYTSLNNLLALRRERHQPEGIGDLVRRGIQLDSAVLGEAVPYARYIDGAALPLQPAPEGGHEAWVRVAHLEEGVAAFEDLGAEACWAWGEAFGAGGGV